MLVQTGLFGTCFVQPSISDSGLSWLQEEGFLARILHKLVG
jgi:hypothetical protein